MEGRNKQTKKTLFLKDINLSFSACTNQESSLIYETHPQLTFQEETDIRKPAAQGTPPHRQLPAAQRSPASRGSLTGFCGHSPSSQNATATVEGLFSKTLGGLSNEQLGTEFMRSLPTNRGGKDSLKDRTGQKAAADGSCGWDRAILLLRAGEESAEGATAVILPSASSPLTLRTWAFLSSSLRGPQKATPRPPPSPLPSGPRSAPQKATSGSARPLT